MIRTPSLRLLLSLQTAQSFAILLSTSVFLPFLKANFSFAQISLQSAVNYAIPILLLPFIRLFRLRAMMLLAFGIAVVRVLMATYIHDAFDLYFNAALAGVHLVLFWVPYEIFYFNKHDRASHGRSSAWYFGAMSITGIIAPLTAGLVADRFGYGPLFALSALCLIVPIALTWKLPRIQVKENLAASLHHLRGVAGLLIFDGFFLSIPTVLIGLSLLTFTKSASEFGTIIALVALVATGVSFSVANLSDRRQNRSLIIYPIVILSSIMLVILGLQKTLPLFLMALVVFTSLRTIVQPIMNALPMDLCTDHAKLYIGRQFYISVGRVIGFGLTWMFALTWGLLPMYVTYALGGMFYLLVVRRALSSQFVLTST